MRLLGVISVKEGWAVQSFAYRRYLPIGDPLVLARTLARWKLDEILIVCIDQSLRNAGPDLHLLERIANSYLGIPVTYGGGIRDEQDCNDAISAGADRVAIDYAIRKNPHIANEMSARIGIQALVGVFPLTATEGGGPLSVELCNSAAKASCRRAQSMGGRLSICGSPSRRHEPRRLVRGIPPGPSQGVCRAISSHACTRRNL